MSKLVQLEKPKYFYKYKPIDKYLFELLETNTLYFSDKDELNDFFDLRFDIDLGMIKKSMINTYIGNDFETKNIENEIYEKVCRYVDILSSNPNFKHDYHEKLVRELDYKICCFTTNKFSSTMWTFYANKYNGVVLEFDFRNDIRFHTLISKVHYKQDIMKVVDSDDIIRSCVVKMKEWSREKEWRIIIIGENKKVSFNKLCLKSITFGFNVNHQDIRRVTELVKSKYENVRFFKLKWVNLEMKRVLC